MGFDERRRTERRAEQHERLFRKGAFLMSTSRMHYGLGFALMGLAACGGNIDVGGNDPAGTAGAGGEQLATGGAGSGGSAGMNTGTHASDGIGISALASGRQKFSTVRKRPIRIPSGTADPTIMPTAHIPTNSQY